jgi:hypothetical protein
VSFNQSGRDDDPLPSAKERAAVVHRSGGNHIERTMLVEQAAKTW